jgi:hypothetical protein
MNMECEIADAMEQKYGIQYTCIFKQEDDECTKIGASDECEWGPDCTECGDLTIRAFDHCSGWNSLCMNPECVMDK